MRALRMTLPCLIALGFSAPVQAAPPYPLNMLPTLACPAGQKVQPGAALNASARECLVDAVATAIAKNYVNSDDAFKQKWAGQVAAARPLLIGAATDTAFYDGLHKLVKSVGNNHVYFLDPTATRAQNAVILGGERLPPGIGALTVKVPGGELIRAVLANGPAARAGMKRGDFIVSVDGRPCVEKCLEGDQKILSVVARRGSSSRTIELPREAVATAAQVTLTRVGPGSAYALMTIFDFTTKGVAVEVERRLKELLAGPPISGLIIDVRSNPGGTAEELNGTLGHFLPTGLYGRHVYKNRNVDTKDVRGSKLQPALKNMPVRILIDGQTNSAGELFSGIMQGADRALIIGTPSAGVAERIDLYNLPDDSRLVVAVAEFYDPKNRVISGRGVIPDIPAAAPWWTADGPDPDVEAALRSFTPAAQ